MKNAVLRTLQSRSPSTYNKLKFGVFSLSKTIEISLRSFERPASRQDSYNPDSRLKFIFMEADIPTFEMRSTAWRKRNQYRLHFFLVFSADCPSNYIMASILPLNQWEDISLVWRCRANLGNTSRNPSRMGFRDILNASLVKIKFAPFPE